jgi:hypothetical protein
VKVEGVLSWREEMRKCGQRDGTRVSQISNLRVPELAACCDVKFEISSE